jgi:hypothetical protein
MPYSHKMRIRAWQQMEQYIIYRITYMAQLSTLIVLTEPIDIIDFLLIA